MLSAPLMLTTATNSSLVTFQQESIAMIAAQSNAIMSYPWDEQNTESQSEYGILDTNSPTVILKRDNNITAGMMRRKKRVLGVVVEINASLPATFGTQKDIDPGTISLEATRDDIDDFDGNISRLVTADGAVAITDEGDYIDKSIIINTKVRYYSDASSSANFSTCKNAGAGCAYSNPVQLATTTNVKFITSELNSTNDSKNIVMKMFMCNIGTAVPDKAIK